MNRPPQDHPPGQRPAIVRDKRRRDPVPLGPGARGTGDRPAGPVPPGGPLPPAGPAPPAESAPPAGSVPPGGPASPPGPVPPAESAPPAGAVPPPGPTPSVGPPPPAGPGAEDVWRARLQERTADLQRLKAEYDNYRKRVRRDHLAVREIAVGNVLARLLPVLDAIDAAREHGDAAAGGFEQIAGVLERQLSELGLESFGAEGDSFDPTVHEALSHLQTDRVGRATCAAVHRPGYRVGGHLLRPAQVTVAGPPVAPPPVTPPAGADPAGDHRPGGTAPRGADSPGSEPPDPEPPGTG